MFDALVPYINERAVDRIPLPRAIGDTPTLASGSPALRQPTSGSFGRATPPKERKQLETAPTALNKPAGDAPPSGPESGASLAPTSAEVLSSRKKPRKGLAAALIVALLVAGGAAIGLFSSSHSSGAGGEASLGAPAADPPETNPGNPRAAVTAAEEAGPSSDAGLGGVELVPDAAVTSYDASARADGAGDDDAAAGAPADQDDRPGRRPARRTQRPRPRRATSSPPPVAPQPRGTYGQELERTPTTSYGQEL